ncbi:MAG: S8 family peptidase [Candidatus Kariarchaeaceae archaeon]
MKTKVTMLFVVAIMIFGVGITNRAHSDSVEIPELTAPLRSIDHSFASQKVDTYIVMMLDLPVVSYDGSIDGFEATKATKGLKINPNSANVKKYANYLKNSHNDALSSVGLDSNAVVYDYAYALNGFSARMTGAQAKALTNQPNVFSATPDEIQTINTVSTPEFLGLEEPGGAFAKGYDGEGVIVGIVDTGIYPEHPSFADDGTYGPAPEGWSGEGCDFGDSVFNPDDVPFECNNKLLAAKNYNPSVGLPAWEFNSARDYNGHGSHTASTAAGNSGVAASVERGGETLNLGEISGIAPRARLSVYKVCVSTEDGSQASCATSGSAAAIDQAVADGVDVINFSIGDGASLTGAVDIAFLFAADAGVSVAHSAGNSGPGAGSVAGSGPWETSVGASTHDREYEGTVTLGDGQVFVGASRTSGTPSLQLIDSVDAVLSGQDPYEGELCYPGTLDPAVVEGKIVLCRRGDIARVDKSLAVYMAGGAGMIMYNPGPQTLNADLHSVPSIHVDHVVGPIIKQYIADNGASSTAQLSDGVAIKGQGSVMAAFSSRGPMQVSQDIVGPDVTAPGVDILAAVAQGGDIFDSYAGTSMAAPHVAGLYAILAQAYPDWSTAMAKSALMTTARQDVTKEDGVTPADAFDMGAGHVDASGAGKGSFLEPGLAYDAGWWDWAAFACGTATSLYGPASCAVIESWGYSLDASDYNSPAIAIGELGGSQTVTRTVTDVAKELGWRTFSVSVDAPDGVDVTVTPSSFSLKSGMSATYEVTFTSNSDAQNKVWSFGSLTWNDMTGHYSVRSNIAVRPLLINAPIAVDEVGTSGSGTFDVSFGYNGDYTPAVAGLIPSTNYDDVVLDDPTNNWDTATIYNDHFFMADPNVIHARFALYDEYTDGDDDLDMYVYGYHPVSGWAEVGSSGSPTSDELVDLIQPVYLAYTIFIHGWETDGPDAAYTLFTWQVQEVDELNMNIDSAPASATFGGSGVITYSWSGLSVDTKYLGAVTHYDASGLMAYTLVSINTD